MSKDWSDVRAETPAAGLAEDERIAEAQERLKDAVAEFGPDAPPRGATPGNAEAESEPDSGWDQTVDRLKSRGLLDEDAEAELRANLEAAQESDDESSDTR